MNEISDDLLVCLYRERNQDAIDLLYERYNRFLYGIINDVLRNSVTRYDYDELFQDSILIFINCIEKYDEENGCFYFFVRKCVERKIMDCINKLKKRNKILSLDSYKYNDCEDSYLDFIAEEETPGWLTYGYLMERLNATNREIVELKVAGYSYLEIAKMLGLSKQCIYRKINKIKNILKDIIEKID